ncbi:hypothetical protein Tco_1046164 [Tanacetum coccineum]
MIFKLRKVLDPLIVLTDSRPDIMFAICACARSTLNRAFGILEIQPFDLEDFFDTDYCGASLTGNPQPGMDVVNFLARGVMDSKSNA